MIRKLVIMPHIQPLDPHVADLIAAGEVVERPASVVKELMENAIDAGAKSVSVEIQHGGMTLIRVTDDGCGIPPEEAETAFLRHATSKIRTEYDLEAISTLGFRGEALAAIAAVSRVELLTCTADAPMGVALALEGGAVVSREEAGCPRGTTLIVRDLFYNTPARLKFMKKDAAEGAAVFVAVQRTALSHPEVSVRFLRDGKQELFTPGDGALRSALYAVLGRDMALGFTPVKGSGEDMSVSGFVSLPACCRGTRGYQYFFVNGRFVKSRTMMAALEEAYANQKMVGKFPGCVLHLTCRLSGVDVNVHPTKQEVKFGSERQVFSAVYHAVQAALEADHTRPRAELSASAVPAPRDGRTEGQAGGVCADSVTPNQTVFRAMTAQEFRSPAAHPAPSFSLNDFTAPRTVQAAGTEIAPKAAPTAPVSALFPPEGKGAAPVHAPSSAPAAVPDRSAAPQPVPKPQPEPATQPWRVAGEVLNTYIIVEQGDKILFIDKHAAHERLNFDRLKAEGYTPMVQALLTPVVFTPAAEEGAALLAHLPLLARFGFEAEDFGGGAILVRAAPGDIAAGEIEATLCDLAGRLLTTGRADPDAARDALLHTMACKAAIKGGQKNAPEELQRVAEAVVSGAVRYCPHGRPVAIELTRAQLEKQFKRA